MRTTAAAGILFALTLTGCTGNGDAKLYPVSGKVYVNGRPAENAVVVFHPVAGSGTKPRATVKADGSFEVTTLTTGDGAPAGGYAVTVEWWLTGPKPADADRPPTNHLPAKYARPESSGLTATVTDGPNVLPTYELKK